MTAGPSSLSLLDQLRDRRHRCQVIGHRGAMGTRPENTMASFEHAVLLGADWIELDVHLTRDGALAVIHDERLERTTNGRGFVKDFTVEELKRLDAGSWFGPEYAGEHIPLLPEVLVWARQQGLCVDVEIKNAPVFYPGIEQAVVREARQCDMVHRMIVISFDHVAVGRVKQIEPAMAAGILYAGRPVDAVALAKQAEADALLPHWAYVTPEDVVAAHAAGLAVGPWVSSDPTILGRLLAAGVDAIGTNDPDVLRRLVDASQVSVSWG